MSLLCNYSVHILNLYMLPLACGRAGHYYYLIIYLIFEYNLIIKFTIETILECVKNEVYNSLFVRKALMLVYKLQDKLSPQTNEKYSFQY